MNPIDDDAGGDRQRADTEFEEATPKWRDPSDPASHMARQDENSRSDPVQGPRPRHLVK